MYNSVVNLRKLTRNNLNLDLVLVSAHAKIGPNFIDSFRRY